jgi:hypothetical protein
MTSTIRIGLVLAAFAMLAGTSSLAQLPIQDIQLFNATALPQMDTNRGDQANSIDGNLSTFSYLTPSYAIGDRFAGLDLGSATTINRLQVTKYSDVDGAGSPVDPMDLQLLYTTDTGPISSRHYQPVSGLTNGYLGTEQIVADSVNSADATVVKDITNGTYSLSFNSVSATGLALKYTRDPSGDYIENYYPTAEFKPMNGTTPQAATGIDIWRPAMPAGSVNVARGTQFAVLPTDQDFAIDGDTNTWTYLTRSYTDGPTAITLDLGGTTAVNRIRVDKVTNQVTGSGIVEPMNVQILYTTDTGPMNERTFHPVSGLHSGFNGTELVHATSVDSSTATVLSEIAQFSTDGWFSLTFGEVNATAIEYLIAKPNGSANPYINYPIAEFQLYDSVIVGVPGDYNNNGVVDMADYVLWRNGGPLQNEVNTPGTVDASDYDAWRARFGNTSGSGSSVHGAAVPEPGSVILLILGGMIALPKRYHVSVRPVRAN